MSDLSNPGEAPKPLDEDALLAESDDDALLGEVEVEDDEPEGAAQEEPAAQFDFTPAPRAPRPRTPVKKANPDQTLKATAIPLLITIGSLLLVPAIWATLLLMGAGVWRSTDPNAKTMAMVMLMCWPIGLMLIGGAVYFFKQIQREKAALNEPKALK